MEARPPTPMLFARHMRQALNADPERGTRIRQFVSQLRPANTVIHFQRSQNGAPPEAHELFPSPANHCFTGFKPSPSGCHTRTRLASGAIVMIFNQNLISAGKLAPSEGIQSTLGLLWSNTRTPASMAGISSAAVAVDAPNMVVHGEMSFERTHEWMKAQSFANGSDKFPGFAAVSPKFPPAVTPELYPSRKEKHNLRFIIPGLRSASDLVQTLDTLIELTRPRE